MISSANPIPLSDDTKRVGFEKASGPSFCNPLKVGLRGYHIPANLAERKFFLVRGRGHNRPVEAGEVELRRMPDARRVIVSRGAEGAALPAIMALIEMEYHLSRGLFFRHDIPEFYRPHRADKRARGTGYTAFIRIFGLASEPLGRLMRRIRESGGVRPFYKRRDSLPQFSYFR